MSWLARSIANSLRIDDDDDSQSLSTAHVPLLENSPTPENDDAEGDVVEGDRRGVKDDLTEFRETLTRQLWGVANFLAPPPSRANASHSQQLPDPRVIPELNRQEMPNPSVSGDDGESSDYVPIATAHCDHSEIGTGNLRNLDNNRAVSENYKSGASPHRFLLQNVELDEEEDEDEQEDEDWISQAAGLTDEVLTFAGNIAHHPETWLDFPVEDEEDLEDFPMSESQKRHAQAIEHLTPTLAALRIELCPAHMSVGFFWKVYFVLLHSRLNKQDAELLSTPEIVEARAQWMQELQKRAKKGSERYHVGYYARVSADLDEDFTPRSLHNDNSETMSSWTFASEPASSSTTADSDTEKHGISSVMQFTEKSIIDDKPLAETEDKNNLAALISKKLVSTFDDDDDDEWPEDDCLGPSAAVIPVGIDEEVSFSDLENDECCIPVKSKPEFRV